MAAYGGAGFGRAAVDTRATAGHTQGGRHSRQRAAGKRRSLNRFLSSIHVHAVAERLGARLQISISRFDSGRRVHSTRPSDDSSRGANRRRICQNRPGGSSPSRCTGSGLRPENREALARGGPGSALYQGRQSRYWRDRPRPRSGPLRAAERPPPSADARAGAFAQASGSWGPVAPRGSSAPMC